MASRNLLQSLLIKSNGDLQKSWRRSSSAIEHIDKLKFQFISDKPKDTIPETKAQLENNVPPIKEAIFQNLSAETEREVKHHSKYAEEWWNKDGIMKPLHALNQIRVPFIRDGLIARGNISCDLIRTPNVLKDQKILEVGCGGGILTEHLARLGAKVTGIDLSEALIDTARCHLKEKSNDLQSQIEYKIEPIEVHANNRCEFYDAVVVSEVLEHVDDKIQLLDASVKSLKPNGSIFITTLNKTVFMWVGGVLIGEYVLNLAPKGTHHWDKMISPLDCQRILDTLNCQTVLVNGSTYDFWSNSWRWINNTKFCYALQAIKIPVN